MIDGLLYAWHTFVLLFSTAMVVLIALNVTRPAVAVELGVLAVVHDQLYRLVVRERRRALGRSRARWTVPFRVWPS